MPRHLLDDMLDAREPRRPARPVFLFRRMARRRAAEPVREPPRAEPWPDGMPPRPQRVRQPQRDDSPPLHDPDRIPWQAAMSGPVDAHFDPCGYVLIKARTGSEGERA